MRTMSITMALMLLASALSAQAKKATKPVAVATAQTAPAASASEPTKAAKGSSMVKFAIWGGYNFASSESFTTIDNLVKEADGNFTAKKSSTVTKGGIAAGADFLLGGDLQYGLGVSYMQIYKLSWANSEGATKASIEANIAYLPIHAQALYNISGFKIGVGAGLALGFGETKSSVTGSADSTTKVKGSALSIGAIAAYGFDFGGVTTDIGVRYFAIFDDKLIHNIVPNITVGYKF